VGIGPSDGRVNPFLSARLGVLEGLLGGIPTLDDPALSSETTLSLPLDATLGVPGRPQSGTGQTSLLTGVNAARVFGRHFGPWTPVHLRPVLAESNVLRRVQATGRTVAFANAYPKNYLDRVPTRRQAAPPLAALSAGVLVRHEEALALGDAVASGIVNTGWRQHLGFTDIPPVSADQAGRHLARIADTAHLTLYAHYDTDHAGHAGSQGAAEQALRTVDEFLGGIVAELNPDTLLVVASDHGNIEESTGGHTTNPVLGLLHRGRGLGSVRHVAERARDITHVPELILDSMGIKAAH